MVTSNSRGNPISYVNNQWVYDDGTPVESEEKPCTRCGRIPTPEGYDACLGYIDDVSSACCGHGVEEPYEVKSELQDERRGSLINPPPCGAGIVMDYSYFTKDDFEVVTPLYTRSVYHEYLSNNEPFKAEFTKEKGDK